MKLYAHDAYQDVPSSYFRRAAAATGWLVETSDQLLCGFGLPLRQLQIPLNDWKPTSFTELFSDLVADDGQPAIAFTISPFSSASTSIICVPEYTIIRSRNGKTQLLSTRSVAPRLEEFCVPPRPTLPTPVGTIDFHDTPSPEHYSAMVASAVRAIKAGELYKVVLARKIQGRARAPISTADIVERFHEKEPGATLYSFPISSTSRITGASPELLVEVSPTQIACRPLAGTVVLRHENDEEHYTDWLLTSAKNQLEHKFVVDDIVERLKPFTDSVFADQTPKIMQLRLIAHLSTDILGHRSSSASDGLAIMAALHPTPAVGGSPRDTALSFIERLELGARGFYAGSVGYLDGDGNGQWWVTIRGILSEGNEFEIWAGAGIVAESDPVAEREETSSKLRSVAAGLVD